MGTAPARRLAADRALSRAAGAPLVGGNAVRWLCDGAENYPAWLAAIRGATAFVHFDCYMVHDDGIGEQFADALIARARAGIRVRLLFDWVGALGATSTAFRRRLRQAGVDVRAFNPPVLWRPLAWLSRDHRKMLAVDGRVAFVSGLCVGDDWVGTATRQAWRDTGIEIRGPAVADVHAEFAEIWQAAGGHLLDDEVPPRQALPAPGDVSLRIIGTTPASASMLRLDTLVAALARERLWITDAYFVGLPHYVQALTAAAADGVDVRLLVPGSSDLPLVGSFTRAGYRGLLEGGVRVFEWNGSMMHAKTAVADGLWARVGSTNLNVQSWMGNWEMDVAIEDRTIGAEAEAMFERDLGEATEVVLTARRRGRRPVPGVAPKMAASASPPVARRHRGTSGRAAAGALRIGHTMSAALSSTRPLGSAEWPTLLAGALLLAAIAGVAVWRPAWLAYPIAVLSAWLGLSLVAAAWRVWAGRA